jgi:hypothetical protein
VRPLVAKLIDRVVLLAATVLLAARQYDFPSKEFWSDVTTGRPYVVPVLVTVIGIFGAFTPFQGHVARRRVERRAAIRRQILERFGKMLAGVRRVRPPLDIGDLGLHVWRVRRSLRHPVYGRLTRVATYRLGSTPATRSFTPAMGVGVVGLCWACNAEAKFDVEKLASELPTERDFDAYRAVHGSTSVMGLTWTEFQRLKHRGAVFAAPIRNGLGAFVGCVSVDAGHGFTYLDTKVFWNEINSLCDLISQDRFQNL